MMNILGNLFNREGHSYIRLDGSTPVGDRQVLIDKYNQFPDDYFIFLLSTRAGGLGINLSTADTVIFYDIAFNPQVDRQAEDRCHRIGQKKQVNVITLLTKDSCEEQIWEMAHEKKELNDIMLQEGNYSKKIKDSEDNDIIEEKEEELGSDVAMQLALNQIFGATKEGEEVAKEKEMMNSGKTTSPSKKKFKKDPAEEKKPISVEHQEKVEKVKKTKQPKSVVSKKKEPSPKGPKKAATPRATKVAKIIECKSTTTTTTPTSNPNLAITLKKPASKLTIINPNAAPKVPIQVAAKKKEKMREYSDFSDNEDVSFSRSDGPSSSFDDDDDEDGDY
jgi:outer membrane biosynthesis protein TonB